MAEFINKFQDGEITGYSPDAKGDYYKLEDAQIDHNYLHAKIADSIRHLSQNPGLDCLILYGGIVTDAGSAKVDISAGAALGKNTDGNIRFITIPALSAVDIPSGWNDDRQIWVVLNYAYKQTTDTRQHKITNESYHYILEDSYNGIVDTDDLFVDADPNSSPDTVVCLGSFSVNGVTNTKINNERTQEFTLSSIKGQQFLNSFRNPRFNIRQRGDGPFTASEYGPDGCYIASTVTTHSLTLEKFTVGQTTVPHEPKYFMKSVVTSVAGAGSYHILKFHVHGVHNYSGQEVTLSFHGWETTGKSVAIEFEQYFGAAGSATVDTYVGQIAMDSGAFSGTVRSLTFTVPSISGKTIGTDNKDYIAITIFMDAGSDFNARTGTLGQQSGTFYFADMCLNLGNVALPASAWALSPDVERGINNRYYYQSWGDGAFSNKGNPFSGMPVPSVPTASVGSANFPIPMINIPSVTIYDSAGSSGKSYQPGLAVGLTASVFYIGKTGFFEIDGAVAYTTGSPVTAHFKASAEL